MVSGTPLRGFAPALESLLHRQVSQLPGDLGLWWPQGQQESRAHWVTPPLPIALTLVSILPPRPTWAPGPATPNAPRDHLHPPSDEHTSVQLEVCLVSLLPVEERQSRWASALSAAKRVFGEHCLPLGLVGAQGSLCVLSRAWESLWPAPASPTHPSAGAPLPALPFQVFTHAGPCAPQAGPRHRLFQRSSVLAGSRWLGQHRGVRWTELA